MKYSLFTVLKNVYHEHDATIVRILFFSQKNKIKRKNKGTLRAEHADVIRYLERKKKALTTKTILKCISRFGRIDEVLLRKRTSYYSSGNR